MKEVETMPKKPKIPKQDMIAMANFPAADDGKDKAAQSLGRRGGEARAKSLSGRQRSEIAKKGAAARWRKG
jgi:hypothetical protein